MIAGIGFVRMAWELAQQRTSSRPERLPHRHAAAQTWNGPDAEFYRIFDEAELQFATLPGAYGWSTRIGR